MEWHIFYAMMLCTVVETVGVRQNYTATTLTTSFIVLQPTIRDQPREGGREKLMNETGKIRDRIRPTQNINRKNSRKVRRKENKLRKLEKSKKVGKIITESKVFRG